MAISIQVEHETGLAVCTCSGVFNIDDAKEGVKSLWRAEKWPRKTAVWDFTSARFDVSCNEIEQVAKYVLYNQPATPLKVAFVAPGDLEYGLSRIFEAHRQDGVTEFRVFRDLGEALNWARMPKTG